MEHEDAVSNEEGTENNEDEGQRGKEGGDEEDVHVTGVVIDQDDTSQNEKNNTSQEDEEEETPGKERLISGLAGPIGDDLIQSCTFDSAADDEDDDGDDDEDSNLKSPNIPGDELVDFTFGDNLIEERDGEENLLSSSNDYGEIHQNVDSSSNQNLNDSVDKDVSMNERTEENVSDEDEEQGGDGGENMDSSNEVDEDAVILFDNDSKVADDNAVSNDVDDPNQADDGTGGGGSEEKEGDEVEVVHEDANNSKSSKNNDSVEADDEKAESEEEESEVPMIRVKSDGLFAEEEDEDDEQHMADPNDIHNLMQVEMAGAAAKNSYGSPTRPRRAAAAAAANVIRETISSLEQEDGDESAKEKSRDKGSSETFIQTEGVSQEARRCNVCKKVTPVKVTVRQYGQDIYFCTQTCFNIFRNPDASKRPLPCAKCGIIKRDNVLASCYYWETMNFCSDLCVGNFQMEIGGRCATCVKKVAWGSLGKYCVRFGSDVRQFCSAFCLDAYKKNARVCFHCQLDIKKLSNVILANIPAKSSPKEFCSQDCVEMYIEQSLHQPVRNKPNQNSVCVSCTTVKPTFRELIAAVDSYKVCSERCWTKLLEMKNIRRPVKCEICSKYVDFTICSDPKLYVSTHKKVYGFCSPTCKNVYVLRSRQILACTTCKVKKYNYDLIEHIDEGGISTFAVCSLNCIPKPSSYIVNLRETLTPAATASEMLTKSRAMAQESNQASLTTAASRIRTQIVSVDGSSNTEKGISDEARKGIRIVSTSVLANNGLGASDTADGSGPLQTDADEIIELSSTVNKHVVVTDEEMDDILASVESCIVFPPKEPKEHRNKGCLVRPYSKSVGVQVGSDAPCEGCSGSCQQRKEKYVPILIPVFVPFPFYALESPVPIPLPVPLPVPIPIPLVLPANLRDNSSFVAGNGLQTPQTSLQNAPVITPSSEMPEPMAIDPVSGFLDLGGPNVGESDSFDILNTIPNLDMELGLGGGHLSAGGSQMMNQTGMMPDSTCTIMGNVVTDPSASLHWRQPLQQQTILRGVTSIPSHPGLGRDTFAVRVWQEFFGPEADPLLLSDEMLCEKLKELVEKGRYPTGERFQPSFVLYLCLGLQQYLRSHQRNARIFYHRAFENFVQAFVSYTEFNYQQGIVETVIDESHFWESSELGVNSPEALLFTLVYYNFKFFNLRTWQEHESLTFEKFFVGTKIGQNSQRYKYLTLVGPFNSASNIEVPEVEPQNKCFVKLFEFYKYKCVNSAGPFYKAFIPQPPSKGKWYSAEPLSQMEIYRMLIRAMMIKS